jgi:hypothetical protein
MILKAFAASPFPGTAGIGAIAELQISVNIRAIHLFIILLTVYSKLIVTHSADMSKLSTCR